MHLEFSWANSIGKPTLFRTDCPIIGECMMRSKSDFPSRTKEIQDQFNLLYGSKRGSFEALLRTSTADSHCSTVQTNIKGLSVRILRNTNQVFDLTDRPNNYS
ncbi:MAG TPA: hypothetical protein VJK52_02160 [Candidatus Nanoarchaeia archaeon]|nr:hypothetical protein [Candidatus Nanoarchaeia archaeon]